MNPYLGQDFFGFFYVLVTRLFAFLRGNLSPSDLTSDEIQILVLVGISASAALVGTFLVLRRMTMLANSISHTILIGIVVDFLLTQNGLLARDGDHAEPINIQAMLIASLAMGVITAFLTEFLTKKAKLQEDASTGLVFTSLFALGIVLVTLLTRNVHIGTEVVMGNVDALHFDDFKLAYFILGMNLILFFLFYKEYKLTTFDPALSRALGFSTTFFNYLLMTQASATIVGAFRAVGVLMVLAFITGPVLTARLLTNSLKTLLGLAVLIGAISSIIGVALARHLLSLHGIALTTAGIVVCMIVFIYIIVLAFHFAKRFL
jgi:manganese/zinc/iron transport system permease protein